MQMGIRLTHRLIGAVLIAISIVLVFTLYLSGSSNDKIVVKFHEYQSVNIGKYGPLAAAEILVMQGKQLRTYVVEEHHEVLPYWYAAVKDRVIPSSGNVLLHIDGHSDAAPPVLYDGFPLSAPTTQKQLRIMMQRNDAFIAGAILTGLINHVIWVWPKWDRADDHEDVGHSSIPMYIGETYTYYPDEEMGMKTACMCSRDDNDVMECKFLNITDENAKDGSDLDPAKCSIKRTFIYEEIREDIALQMRSNGTLLANVMDKNAPLLLDIDEDFYGCEEAVRPLLAVGADMKVLTGIDKTIGRLLCPQTTAMESKLDDILYDAIGAIILEKECTSSTHNTKCKSSQNRKKIQDISDIKVFPSDSRCPQKGKVSHQQYWTKVIKALRIFTVKQLAQLQELGFCMRTTPKAYDFGSDDRDDPSFLICHGVNIPGQGIVTYHSPSFDETRERTNLLQHLIGGIPKPKLVTVCRSMRDGYTPRQQFAVIENDILDTLTSTFRDISVVYDVDLLGGKKGWPFRHANE